MSDVERERETLAREVHRAVYGGDYDKGGKFEKDVSMAIVGTVLAALPGLGWVRRKDMLAEQAAATELTRLSQEQDLP